MIFREMLPRRGVDGWTWGERLLTAGRALVLLVALIVGWQYGADRIGPAWFGPGTWWGLLGSLVGVLLALLLVFVLDSCAWITGEGVERDRNDRALARDQAAAAHQRNGAQHGVPGRPMVNRAAGPDGPRRQAPGRPAPAGDPRTTGAVVDERPVSPAAPRSQRPGGARAQLADLEPEFDAGLLVAIGRAVEATGPDGAVKSDILDRLPGGGFPGVTREQLVEYLGVLTSKRGGYRLTTVSEPGEYRYFTPGQLEVTEKVTQRVTAVITNTPQTAGEVRAALGGRVALPLVERVLRILANDLLVIEHDGGFMRTPR